MRLSLALAVGLSLALAGCQESGALLEPTQAAEDMSVMGDGRGRGDGGGEPGAYVMPAPSTYVYPGQHSGGWDECLMLPQGCFAYGIDQNDQYVYVPESEKPVDFVVAGPLEWAWCAWAVVDLTVNAVDNYLENKKDWDYARSKAYEYDNASQRLAQPYLSEGERNWWLAYRARAQSERDLALGRIASRQGVDEARLIHAATACIVAIARPYI